MLGWLTHLVLIPKSARLVRVLSGRRAFSMMPERFGRFGGWLIGLDHPPPATDLVCVHSLCRSSTSRSDARDVRAEASFRQPTRGTLRRASPQVRGSLSARCGEVPSGEVLTSEMFIATILHWEPVSAASLSGRPWLANHWRPQGSGGTSMRRGGHHRRELGSVGGTPFTFFADARWMSLRLYRHCDAIGRDSVGIKRSAQVVVDLARFQLTIRTFDA